MDAISCGACGWSGLSAEATCPDCGAALVPAAAMEPATASASPGGASPAATATGVSSSDFGLRVALLAGVALALVGCVVALATLLIAPKGASNPNGAPAAPIVTATLPSASPLATTTEGGVQPTAIATATQPASGKPKSTATPLPTATPMPTATATVTLTPPTPTPSPTPRVNGG